MVWDTQRKTHCFCPQGSPISKFLVGALSKCLVNVFLWNIFGQGLSVPAPWTALIFMCSGCVCYTGAGDCVTQFNRKRLFGPNYIPAPPKENGMRWGEREGETGASRCSSPHCVVCINIGYIIRKQLEKNKKFYVKFRCSTAMSIPT